MERDCLVPYEPGTPEQNRVEYRAVLRETESVEFVDAFLQGRIKIFPRTFFLLVPMKMLYVQQ